jgi:CheY-like chemotaxis protein
MAAGTIRLLVADDDPTVALLMHAALAGDGFAVTVVDNGRAALDCCARERFDLVLLDVEMPGLDGLEVAAGIRRGAWPATPVVLVSSHGDAAFLAHLAELSASYLAKPPAWPTLGQTLRNLLQGNPPPR